MDLPQQACVEKIAHGEETHQHSGKEKVPGAGVGKESYADDLLWYSSTHHNYFP